MENTSGALMTDVLIELVGRLVDTNNKLSMAEFEASEKAREAETFKKNAVHLSEIIKQRDALLDERDKMIDAYKQGEGRRDKMIRLLEDERDKIKENYKDLSKLFDERMKAYRKLEGQVKRLTRQVKILTSKK